MSGVRDSRKPNWGLYNGKSEDCPKIRIREASTWSPESPALPFQLLYILVCIACTFDVPNPETEAKPSSIIDLKLV